ncbi:MAG: hypothetical protein ACPLYD_16370 [Anaerolineae bacterium]
MDFLFQPWFHLIPRVQFYDRQLLRISTILTDLEVERGLKEQARTENLNPWLITESATRLYSPERNWWVEAGPWRLAGGFRSGTLEAVHEGVQVQMQVWGITAVSAAERPGVVQTAMAIEIPAAASLENVVSVRQTHYLRVATNVYGDRAGALAIEGVVVGIAVYIAVQAPYLIPVFAPTPP